MTHDEKLKALSALEDASKLAAWVEAIVFGRRYQEIVSAAAGGTFKDYRKRLDSAIQTLKANMRRGIKWHALGFC